MSSELFKKQHEIGQEIVQIKNKLQNKEKRTSTLVAYEAELNKLWAKFQENHDNLLSKKKTDHEYFRNDYFESIRNIVEEIRRLLIQPQKEVEVEDNARAEEIGNSKGEQLAKEQFDALCIRFRNEMDEELLGSVSSIEVRLEQLNIFHKILLAEGKSTLERTERYLNLTDRLHQFKANLLLNKEIKQEQHATVSLKAIEIEPFSGRQEHWQSFYEIFTKIIGEAQYIPEVENMMRLKSLVRGEAKELLNHLAITQKNYQMALQILEERYENKRITFTNLVDRILDQPRMDSESSRSIKQMFDTTKNSILSLQGLHIKTSELEPFIARIIVRKFDKTGLRLYEQQVRKPREIQSVDNVLEFLQQQYLALEAATEQEHNKNDYPSKKPQRLQVERQCPCCMANGHNIADCRKFIGMPVTERKSIAKQKRLCYTCLGHKTDKRCNSDHRCNRCGGRHHSLLHIEFSRSSPASFNANQQANVHTATAKKEELPVLLATAQVRVRSVTGNYVLLRAMIDQGSQITSITEETAQTLGLPRIRNKTEIHGLGEAIVGVSKSMVHIEIRPRIVSNHVFKSQALVLPTLMRAQPNQSFEIETNIWANYMLADPLFNKTDRVDMVIGSDLYGQIMENGQEIKEGAFMQETKLGWIVSGPLKAMTKQAKITSAVTNLERFWEIEEVEGGNNITADDQKCLDYFDETYQVSKDGRITVSMPLKDSVELGESKPQALARLLATEKKFKTDEKLKKEYTKFMQEYEEQGHMVAVAENLKGKYYLPHQAVVKEQSLTTKVRVVFDASAKTSNGKTLNDKLYTGPRLQRDIYDILIKWRLWRYVGTSDVEKMYRQIKVAVPDQEFHYILWRDDSAKPIKQYKLTTVTYGTTAAPFFAVNSLIKIAQNCEDTQIATIIKEDFYMDDLMTGADTITECQYIAEVIKNQLGKFHFKLRKWLSNEREVTSKFQGAENHEVIMIKDDESIKTLGVQWDPIRDEFQFMTNFNQLKKITKRTALSAIARIFDPLGCLAPITIIAKLIIQKLWILQLPWDEEVPEDIRNQWVRFNEDIKSVHKLKIPRWVFAKVGVSMELHGFADASEKAYAAVIYVKSGCNVTLLTAKSKVNPIKNRKTLPKLELCAANLLAHLMHKIFRIINRQCKQFTWSDSTITLAWINNNKNNDKFIRSRVNEIKLLIPEAKWGYVNTKQNPADVASRGIQSAKLEDHDLWWNDPKWLKESEELWPKHKSTESNIKLIVAVMKKKEEHFLDGLIEKISSYTKLQKIVAYVLRFLFKLRGGTTNADGLTIHELDQAEVHIINHHQQLAFPAEMMALGKGEVVNRVSRIVSLHPFLDKKGILRVGGRLQNASMHFNQKHPIIIDNGPLTDLIIRKAHLSTLHGGNRLSVVFIKRKYWIMGVKRSVKKCIRGWVRCIRYNQETSQQMMGNLPEPRVTMVQPFMYTGVDYAGPIWMRCSKTRGLKAFKGYIAVFVCMATKAIHLEAVSDLTTEAFLAALKRFFGRRGKCSHMYSDNGTNFVGADTRLDADLKAAIRNNRSIMPILAEEKIEWHFNPPAAPHHGGIWEAGVKSVKHHLKRVIGETRLTYEEMSTLLCQIEAILNSRPLVYIDNNQEESLDILSPGHFLVGRLLTDVPEHVEEEIGSLNKWKLLQKMKKDFWKRWKNEYLSTLQQRRKWTLPHNNMKKGDVVIIKDELSAPAKWPLGKVEEIHPGSDGQVRVVTVKLQDTTIKRPVQKLCPLVKADEEIKSLGNQNRRGNKVATLMKAFLTCLLLTTIKASGTTNYGMEITSINKSSAVYMDGIGSVNVVASSWNLLVQFQLESFFIVLNRSEEILNQMKTICGRLETFEQQCITVVDLMIRKVEDMDKTNQYLFPGRIKRQKRAPLEFIGSLQHILFGTMDADDRRVMEENMSNLLENQHDLKYLVERQTSVVESTLNVVKRTTEEINVNFKSITERLNMTDVMRNSYFVYKESIKFFLVTKELEIILEENEKLQKEVVGLLIDINHGKLNPVLLTPVQLQKEINKMREHIPEHLKLPGRRFNQLQSIYKLLNAKATLLDSMMVISVTIPLFNDHVSQLYNIIPIPFVINGTKMITVLRQKYLIYNFNEDAYHLMSQSDLNKCQRMSREEVVCDGGWPWIDATDNSCEISAFKPLGEHRCSFVHTNIESLWVKINQPNKWLFKIFHKTSAHIHCSGTRQQILDIPPEGIMSLEAGCTVRVRGAVMTAPFQIKSKLEIQNSQSLTTDLDLVTKWNLDKLGNNTINHQKEIKQLLEQIKTLKTSKLQLRELNFHHITGHLSLGIMLLVIITLLIIFCIHKRKQGQVIKLDFSPLST